MRVDSYGNRDDDPIVRSSDREVANSIVASMSDEEFQERMDELHALVGRAQDAGILDGELDLMRDGGSVPVVARHLRPTLGIRDSLRVAAFLQGYESAA